jgi:hypothetical protein
MRKITKDEFLKMPVKGRGGSSPVYTEILNLQPGEYLVIEKAEWKKRQPPSRVSSYIGKRNSRKFKSFSLLDNSGWVVERIA